MSEINSDKEVYFDQYCPACEYKDLSEDSTPCDDCLNNPVNTYSHKPINFKEAR